MHAVYRGHRLNQYSWYRNRRIDTAAVDVKTEKRAALAYEIPVLQTPNRTNRTT